MDKRVNTFLFVLGATFFNLIVMAILAVLGFLLLSVLPLENAAPGIRSVLMIIVFFGAIIASFFIYHRIVRLISKRVDMEKYFHPIFKDRRGGGSGDG
jgi:hypothetical protein